MSNVLDILKRIREGDLDPGEISVQNRRICVMYLRYEGYTQDEIAEIFGACRQTIARDERANRQQVSTLVNDIDVKSVAGGHMAWAKHLTAKAMREKDHALVWKIQRDLIADLQSLGYLPRAPEQHHLQVSTFADLAELARKSVESVIVEQDVSDGITSVMPHTPTMFEK